jgi:hypothetical protein
MIDCARCGESVEPSGLPRRLVIGGYCSWSCERRPPAFLRSRECKRCHAAFMPSRAKTKTGRPVQFCSTACREEARHDRAYGPILSRDCAVCGLAFYVRGKKKDMACSPECSEIFRPMRRERAIGVRASRLVRSAKERAVAKGLPFTITTVGIAARLRLGVCEVTGVALDFSHRSERQQHVAPFGPSLDRIDPEGGYTDENTQLVAWAYNAAKATGCHADVVALARAVVAAEDRKSNQIDRAAG